MIDKPLHVLSYHRRFRNEELIKYMPYRPGVRVLVCGCGDGTMLEQLAGRTEAAWGVDRALPPSERSLTPDQVSAAESERLPFAAASFDVVFSQDTLAGTAHPVRALSEFARVLCCGGRLILWASRRRLAHSAVSDLQRCLRAASLMPMHEEAFDYLAYPGVLAMGAVPWLGYTDIAGTMTKGLLALDSALARTVLMRDKSWHLFVVARKVSH